MKSQTEDLTECHAVLNCPIPLALFHWRRDRKQQKTAAVQDPFPRNSGSSKLFDLLLSAVALTIGYLPLLHPLGAHAQGGVPLWTNVFRGALSDVSTTPSMALDISGNVFVTGTPEGGGYATIAYSNNGVPLWTNLYNPPSSGGPSGVAVESSGNVFVTGTAGSGSATIAYSSLGLPLWTNRFDVYSSKIAVDNTGNVFVMGVEYTTVKYSNTGVPLWTNRYNGGSARAMALDGAGNVFVTGMANTSGHSGCATIKYSNAGLRLWTHLYNGSLPDAMALDTAGNVFVTGKSSDGNNLDFATVAYSNSGVPLWTNRYNGPANARDWAYAVAVDRSGNVFVAGESVTVRDFINDPPDFATIKYSNSGVPLWTNRYDGPAGGIDYPSAITADSVGNVFVTGASSGAGYATIGYSNSGETLWINTYDGPDHLDAQAHAIAADGDGNVFVTGASSGTDGYTYYSTIKYSSSAPPSVHLDFQMLNNELVLSWTNGGFNLQTAPAVTGPFTTPPAVASPYTNFLTAPRQFFRLMHN